MKRTGSRRYPAPCRGGAGLATVWAAWWVLALLTVGLVGAVGAAVVARQHHLEGAADLVAISGAHELSNGGDACAVAAGIASANQVDLEVCRVEGRDVVVTLTEVLTLPFDLRATINGQARAGPSGIG
jgi:secretion/DNA translocation related TadE-like protein